MVYWKVTLPGRPPLPSSDHLPHSGCPREIRLSGTRECAVHQPIAESSPLSDSTNLQQPEKAVSVYPPSRGPHQCSLHSITSSKHPRSQPQEGERVASIHRDLEGLGQRLDTLAVSSSVRCTHTIPANGVRPSLFTRLGSTSSLPRSLTNISSRPNPPTLQRSLATVIGAVKIHVLAVYQQLRRLKITSTLEPLRGAVPSVFCKFGLMSICSSNLFAIHSRRQEATRMSGVRGIRSILSWLSHSFHLASIQKN